MLNLNLLHLTSIDQGRFKDYRWPNCWRCIITKVLLTSSKRQLPNKLFGDAIKMQIILENANFLTLHKHISTLRFSIKYQFFNIACIMVRIWIIPLFFFSINFAVTNHSPFQILVLFSFTLCLHLIKRHHGINSICRLFHST